MTRSPDNTSPTQHLKKRNEKNRIPVRCDVCGKKYSCGDSLRRHAKKKHGWSRAPVAILPGPPPRQPLPVVSDAEYAAIARRVSRVCASRKLQLSFWTLTADNDQKANDSQQNDNQENDDDNQENDNQENDDDDNQENDEDREKAEKFADDAFDYTKFFSG